MKKLFFVMSLMFAANTVLADDDLEDRRIVYKQKTEIDFESLEVEGQLLKPTSSLVIERKASHFNPLVKLRTDWNEEIDASVKEIK